MTRLETRLQQLWEELGVPKWHRRLYKARYFTGDYGPEVLAREIRALRNGTALVQRVEAAIHHREEILIRLTLLRTGYEDDEFLAAGSLPRMHLSEQLQALRFASVTAVETLLAWRSAVAPRPGKHKGLFAGPSARGALWPYAGPVSDVDDETDDVEDYLLHVARDDTVVRCFDTVLEMSHECDPLLLFGSIGGAGWKEHGKLSAPPADAVHRARLEKARLTLLEEEVALSSFNRPGNKTRDSVCESLPKSGYMESLTAPLRLPLPGAQEVILNDLISEWRGKLASSRASLPIGDRPVLSAVLRSCSREWSASQEIGDADEGKVRRGGTPQHRSSVSQTVKRWRPRTR